MDAFVLAGVPNLSAAADALAARVQQQASRDATSAAAAPALGAALHDAPRFAACAFQASGVMHTTALHVLLCAPHGVAVLRLGGDNASSSEGFDTATAAFDAGASSAAATHTTTATDAALQWRIVATEMEPPWAADAPVRVAAMVTPGRFAVATLRGKLHGVRIELPQRGADADDCRILVRPLAVADALPLALRVTGPASRGGTLGATTDAAVFDPAGTWTVTALFPNSCFAFACVPSFEGGCGRELRGFGCLQQGGRVRALPAPRETLGAAVLGAARTASAIAAVFDSVPKVYAASISDPSTACVVVADAGVSLCSVAWHGDGSSAHLIAGTRIGTVVVMAMPDEATDGGMGLSGLGPARDIASVRLPPTTATTDVTHLSPVPHSALVACGTSRGALAVISVSPPAALFFLDARERLRATVSLAPLSGRVSSLGLAPGSVAVIGAGGRVAAVGTALEPQTEPPLTASTTNPYQTPRDAAATAASGTRASTTTATTATTTGAAAPATVPMEQCNGDRAWTLELRPTDGVLLRSDDLPPSAIANGDGDNDNDPCSNVLDHDDNFFHVAHLGRGAFGSVYLSQRRVAHGLPRYFAVKTAPMPTSALDELAASVLRSFHQEVLNAQRVPPHPSIVRCYGAYQAPRYMGIVLDVATGGTLADAIAHHADAGTRPADATVRGWLVQLLRGLAHLHAHHVIHRDVKPANVLLARNGDALWADFGVSAAAAAAHVTIERTVVGTAAFLAPEILQRWVMGKASTAYSQSADVWSLGAIAYCAMTGRRDGMVRDTAEAARVACGKFEPLHALPDVSRRYSSGLVALVDAMLAIAPHDRPTASAALRSDCFAAASPAAAPSSLASVAAANTGDTRPLRLLRSVPDASCGLSTTCDFTDGASFVLRRTAVRCAGLTRLRRFAIASWVAALQHLVAPPNTGQSLGVVVPARTEELLLRPTTFGATDANGNDLGAGVAASRAASAEAAAAGSPAAAAAGAAAAAAPHAVDTWHTLTYEALLPSPNAARPLPAHLAATAASRDALHASLVSVARDVCRQLAQWHVSGRGDADAATPAEARTEAPSSSVERAIVHGAVWSENIFVFADARSFAALGPPCDPVTLAERTAAAAAAGRDDPGGTPSAADAAAPTRPHLSQHADVEALAELLAAEWSAAHSDVPDVDWRAVVGREYAAARRAVDEAASPNVSLQSLRTSAMA